jgi:hypothetical protein
MSAVVLHIQEIISEKGHGLWKTKKTLQLYPASECLIRGITEF